MIHGKTPTLILLVVLLFIAFGLTMVYSATPCSTKPAVVASRFSARLNSVGLVALFLSLPLLA